MAKLRIFVLCVVLVMPVLLLACAPAAKAEVTVTVSCDKFSKQANIVQDVNGLIGNKIVVTLCSNPTTGFQWAEKAQIGNPQVLEQRSYNYIAPTNTGMVGAPGDSVWTFEAMQPGISVINLEYSRPWEGGEKAVQTFKLNVTIK